MSYLLDDTIVAVASPPGGAARGIVRLSGPDVAAILRACFHALGGLDLSTVRLATTFAGSLHLHGLATPLPCQLYFWPGRRSYTGAPMAEIHTLGSPPLLEAAVHTLCRAGARLAEPGEFTLRAFLAGRIDLTRAEAVLGVVDAHTRRQLDVALSQLAGGLSGPLGKLRDDLLDLLAHLEAGFDFADEDLPFITSAQLDARLASAAQAVQSVAGQLASRSEAADLVRAVLGGCPNTGKSSLFNALAGTPGALVSGQPGTTRDYLIAELDLDGIRCRLIDTAGIQTADDEGDLDEVLRAAQAVAAWQSSQAHVHLLCLDSTRPLNTWERAELARPLSVERLVVLTKCDLPQRTDLAGEAVATSSLTGQGLDTLKRELRRAILSASGPAAGAVAGTAARCGEAVRLAADSLRRARGLVATGGGEELVAAEIRTALEALGEVVGAVYTDDVLDRIFSRFCIGK